MNYKMIEIKSLDFFCQNDQAGVVGVTRDDSSINPRMRNPHPSFFIGD